jgi:hypothetical protein
MARTNAVSCVRVMRQLGLAVLVVAWGALSGRSAVAEGLVLGDSLGIGVAQAAGLKGLARISVHIRGPRALAQINSAPAGSTAFVVLGSNDAEGSIAGLDKSIDAIVEAAEIRGVKLVWLGPPCVRRPWNDRVRQLDAMLERRFAQSAVKYVSMRDDKICSGAFQAGDGVHSPCRATPTCGTRRAPPQASRPPRPTRRRARPPEPQASPRRSPHPGRDHSKSASALRPRRRGQRLPPQHETGKAAIDADGGSAHRGAAFLPPHAFHAAISHTLPCDAFALCQHDGVIGGQRFHADRQSLTTLGQHQQHGAQCRRADGDAGKA